jgi:hypothetical protein
MSAVNEQVLRLVLRHKERLRVAVYAIAGHPETPERVRVIATSALNEIGERLPPAAATVNTGGEWAPDFGEDERSGGAR